MKKVNPSWWMTVMTALVVTVCGCAQTVVKPAYEYSTAGTVLRPAQVFVYDFSVSAADVSENQGFFAGVYNNAVSDTTESERTRAIGQEVRARMTEDLVAGIRDLGLPAQRALRGSTLPPDAIA